MKTMINTGERGFTLIEALVAIVILGFGLLAVVTMIDVSFSATSLSRDTTRATELATMMLDRIIFETGSPNQPYTADLVRLQTFTCDTASAVNPASDPGKTACQEWKTAFNPVIRNAATSLPGGRGVVQITPNALAVSGSHRVHIEVTWQSVFPRQPLVIETYLASSE